MTSAIRVGLDTNILIYAQGFNDRDREKRAAAVLGGVGVVNLVLPTQVVGEFYNALTRKFGVDPVTARTECMQWTRRIAIQPAGIREFDDAIELAATHALQFWDALILATAAEAGCRILLSEDMRHGFVWNGCTVINPFADPMHPLLADALRT